jgi:hypothetical protein
MITMHRRHSEVWDSTPTHSDIVGDADSLPAALMLYMRTSKAARGHTINLLVAAIDFEDLGYGSTEDAS